MNPCSSTCPHGDCANCVGFGSKPAKASACMGGWCSRREKCAHYHADSDDIAERLCQPGEANAFSPIKEAIVTKKRKVAEAAHEGAAKARKSSRHANQKALTVRKPTQKQADTAQMLARIRTQEQSAYRARGDNTPAVPPPGVRVQKLPGYTGSNRYSVDGPISGGFSDLKPGQYAFEPESAAAKAVREGAAA